MLTLETLLKSSDYNIIKNSYKYSLIYFDSKRESGEGNDEKTQVIGIIVGGKSKRKASVVSEDLIITKSSEVVVYCSCDYFVYNLEIPLVLQGSARSLHAEGFPRVKNTKLQPGLCPHLVCLVKAILLKNKNIIQED
jgi:hypothetical protein